MSLDLLVALLPLLLVEAAHGFLARRKGLLPLHPLLMDLQPALAAGKANQPAQARMLRASASKASIEILFSAADPVPAVGPSVPAPLAVGRAAVVASDNDHDDDGLAAKYHTLLFGASPPAVHVHAMPPAPVSVVSNALRALSPTGIFELDCDHDSLADIPTLIDDDSDSDDELDQFPVTVASRQAPATLSYLPSSANVFPDVSSRAYLTPHAAVIEDVQEEPSLYVPPDYDSDDEYPRFPSGVSSIAISPVAAVALHAQDAIALPAAPGAVLPASPAAPADPDRRSSLLSHDCR